MAEFKNEQHGVEFSVPDHILVRTQLAYFSAISEAFGQEMWIRHWEGALQVINGWKCDQWPDPKEIDIDKETDPALTRLILWVGTKVLTHMSGLDAIPKNV